MASNRLFLCSGGTTKKRRKRSLGKKWKKISQAKSRGGIGFKDISRFNQALIAKYG